MGENNDAINSILSENIDKDITINFILTTPVKETPSVSKTSIISKLENYIDENCDEAAKIQLKQAILREEKQQFLMRQKKKDTLMNLFAIFTVKFLHIKVKLAF